jgi:hypothetical protein
MKCVNGWVVDQRRWEEGLEDEDALWRWIVAGREGDDLDGGGGGVLRAAWKRVREGHKRMRTCTWGGKRRAEAWKKFCGWLALQPDTQERDESFSEIVEGFEVDGEEGDDKSGQLRQGDEDLPAPEPLHPLAKDGRAGEANGRAAGSVEGGCK